jgi:hypothetical protein
VRVLDSKDGHGLAKAAVSVQFLSKTLGKASPSLQLQTDSNGETQFTIPEPRPDRLSVEITLNSGNWHCSCRLMADMEAILNKGILRSDAPGNNASNTPLQAEPDYIIFVARPYDFFERFLAPLLKE